jgi:putative ABC transport system ATP-binding protein
MKTPAMHADDSIAIRVRGLSRHFREGSREHVVLDGLDLDIRRGETVALRGRSGSGKSTLLNMVGGIDTPDAGTATVAGVELTDLSERERTLFRRRHIGFVYQAFNLISTLDVADNVRLVLELNGVSSSEASARIDAVLSSVGLRDRAGSYPDVLSGGEQQRVGVAPAIADHTGRVSAQQPSGNQHNNNAEGGLNQLYSHVRGGGGTLVMATPSMQVGTPGHT